MRNSCFQTGFREAKIFQLKLTLPTYQNRTASIKHKLDNNINYVLHKKCKKNHVLFFINIFLRQNLISVIITLIALNFIIYI